MNQDLGDKLKAGLTEPSPARDSDLDGANDHDLDDEDEDLAEEENGGVSGGVLAEDDLGDVDPE